MPITRSGSLRSAAAVQKHESRKRSRNEQDESVSKANTPMKTRSDESNSIFKAGQLVWAKADGSSFWPATVCDPQTDAQV